MVVRDTEQLVRLARVSRVAAVGARRDGVVVRGRLVGPTDDLSEGLGHALVRVENRVGVGFDVVERPEVEDAQH